MNKERHPKPKRIKSYFSYFGAKYKISEKYPHPFEGNIIVEPFAGAAGYSVLNWDAEVKLFDLDPVICSVWNFLRTTSAEEINSVDDDVYLDDPDSDKGLPLEQVYVKLGVDPRKGFRNLIGFWCGRGQATPVKRPGPWMRMKNDDGSMVYPGAFWGPRVKSRLISQLDNLKTWDEVVNCSYADIPESLTQNPDVTWHIDPPYQVAGVTYAKSANDLDYDHLADWVLSLKGQVMVCENAGAPWLQRLVDATGIPVLPLVTLNSTRKKPTKEVIWTNDLEWINKKEG